MKILSVKIDSLSFQEAVRYADILIRNKKSAYIVTLNPEIIMAATKNAELKRIINRADLVTPDGFGLMLAAKFLGTPLKERLTGVDLTWGLIKLAEDRGYSVFLLGGAHGVAKKAAQNIKRVHPNLKIVGISAADPGDKGLIDTIGKAKPDILFVAYGAPKQEKFIYKLIHSSHSDLGFRISDLPKLSVGVGGTFDYIAGFVPYAPVWIRKLGLEWLYRLLTQPKRLNRIITATIRFPWGVLRSKYK